MTFLLSEDKALRESLQGITVTDQKADAAETSRPVGVWFGQPDQEIRTQSYPYITIDMVDISRDAEREMRGMVSSEFINGAEYLVPDNVDPEKGWEIELPIPVNIDYQITTYARHPRHDREIIAQLLYQKLPFRFGQLSLDDGTLRRLEVMDVSKRDLTEQAKRLFVNAVTVRVVSEVAQKSINELYRVQTSILEPIQIIEIVNNP
jgi:hypothetical protein